MRSSIIFFFIPLLMASCGGDNKAADVEVERAYLFGFTNNTNDTENFVAVTSDLEVIEQVDAELAVPFVERTLFINGKIDFGNGGHNLSWSWHFIENQWELTAFSVEVCDGIPLYIEDDLEYWIETVERFCPWQSRVIEAL